MVKTFVKLENFDLEYAQYVVNPYGWARQATLYDVIWLEDIIEYGDSVKKKKALEMMDMIDRVQNSFEKTSEWDIEERLLAGC